MVYEPAEDSFLIKDCIKNNIKKNDSVLDMGSGSGILAIEASKYTKDVTAADIDPKAIAHIKKSTTNIKSIKVIKTNLFSKIKNKFDLILFNAPYLPFDKNEDKESRLATTGGVKGYETIEKFIQSANDNLNKNGKILLLFSNLTKKDKVNKIIKNYGFEFRLLKSQKMFFEELYVYKITKSDLLDKLSELNVTTIKSLTKGHRGLIFTGTLNNTKVAIKSQRQDIDAINTVNREITFLKKLNKNNIGPRLIKNMKNAFIYEFIDGIFFEEYIKNNNKTKIKQIISKVFKKMYTLDTMGINKEEMHNPFKHIIIDKNDTPWLIDFERANYTKKPKNVTQFVQYMCHLKQNLQNKKIMIDVDKLRDLAKTYKRNINMINLNNILKEIK